MSTGFGQEKSIKKYGLKKCPKIQKYVLICTKIFNATICSIIFLNGYHLLRILKENPNITCTEFIKLFILERSKKKLNSTVFDNIVRKLARKVKKNKHIEKPVLN